MKGSDSYTGGRLARILFFSLQTRNIYGCTIVRLFTNTDQIFCIILAPFILISKISINNFYVLFFAWK